MFQFSLKTLFILTTAFAVLVWILFSPPEWVGVLVLTIIFALLPAANLAGLIYHSGAWRAFFVGTSPSVIVISWYAIMLNSGGRRYWLPGNSAIEMKLVLMFVLAIIIGSGLVAVGIRWWANTLNPPTEGP
ncbi:MAG TPA: hypothetical protein VMP01_28370 [Pirellulaceae bacterium]|nr:hypothetical protein [Pirellulaceae bacterium]